jgi:hypothetical protein
VTLATFCLFSFFSGQVQAADFSDSYLGGSVGTAYHSLKVDGEGSDGNKSTHEGFLTFFAGYGMVKNKYYYGIEFDIFLNDTTSKTNVSEKYSPILRGGYIFSDVFPDIFYEDLLLYGLLGWQSSYIAYNNNEKRFYGTRIGTGVEYQIKKQIYNREEKSDIFFRGEINYINYSNEEVTDQITISPSSIGIHFGLGIRF